VTHHYYPNHPHLRRNIGTLVEAGYGVDIICLKRKGEKWKETVDDVNIYRIPVEHRRMGFPRYLTEYAAGFVFSTLLVTFLHLRRRYAAIEVTNMPDFLVFCTLLPKLLGAKVILTIFDNMPEYFAFNHGMAMNHLAVRLLRLMERASAAYTDRVVVTQRIAKEVLESHGVQSAKMTIVLNTPDEGIFEGVSSGVKAMDGRRFVVMTHGEMCYSYGNQTIIRAVPLLLERIPELEVWMVGEGEYLYDLIKLSHDLDVADHVCFTGLVPHAYLPLMMSKANVGIVPKLVDLMLPTKLMEYVAAGMPVVASAQPTMKAYFNDDAISFFDPGDEQDLARCILDLYTQPAKAASMSARASAAYDNYRWKRTKHDYLGVYEALLA